MIPLTNENLLAFLKKKEYYAEIQKETDQITVILNIDGMQFPMFIRKIPEGPVLQLLVFLPCSLRENTINDLSRLLHLLNKEMDIPGFGTDESAGVIFYRITIPVLQDSIDSLLFETYLKSFHTICKTFTPVIINVAQGTMSFEAILQKAKEEHSISRNMKR